MEDIDNEVPKLTSPNLLVAGLEALQTASTAATGPVTSLQADVADLASSADPNSADLPGVRSTIAATSTAVSAFDFTDVKAAIDEVRLLTLRNVAAVHSWPLVLCLFLCVLQLDDGISQVTGFEEILELASKFLDFLVKW